MAKKGKKLTAAHKRAISEGMKEHYASLGERSQVVSQSLDRLSRAGKRFIETVAIGANLARSFMPRRPRTVREKILEGTRVVDTLSGSVGRIANAGRSVTGTIDTAQNIFGGLKGEKLRIMQEGLNLRRQLNQTNRQVHAVRARLERDRLAAYVNEAELRAHRAKSYRIIARSSASKASTLKRDSASRAVRYHILHPSEARVVWADLLGIQDSPF